MLKKWPIRNKLLTGLGLLLVLVGTLSFSGFHSAYTYRSTIKSLHRRVQELPAGTQLSKRVSDLRVALHNVSDHDEVRTDVNRRFALEEFKLAVETVRSALESYRGVLTTNDVNGGPIGDGQLAWRTVKSIDRVLAEIEKATSQPGWADDPAIVEPLTGELNSMQKLAAELPIHLHASLHDAMGEIRTQYRVLIVLVWVTSLLSAIMLIVFLRLFYKWVFRPLRVLIKGSRKVAAGDFNFHIQLDGHDEMTELADALNRMTSSFRAVRDDLDRQVRDRTKQVVRSERLASVGFLAAGVAHEINNPLASIAMCAESLESRLSGMELPDDSQAQVVQHYLKMIQSEAFRCKEITDKLLDYSRMGSVKKQSTNLRELVQGVVDMLAHLGKYQDRRVELVPGEPLAAEINAQEIKQVVLNLLTNALDSLDPGGTVWIDLAREGPQAVLTFTDNGCGMSEDVLEHLFEPFFTRRRGGQGTGLGLSITYRIVADHHGQIQAASDGPGQGSQFRVTLPLTEQEKESSHQYQAA